MLPHRLTLALACINLQKSVLNIQKSIDYVLTLYNKKISEQSNDQDKLDYVRKLVHVLALDKMPKCNFSKLQDLSNNQTM
jgi:hypothetical protein